LPEPDDIALLLHTSGTTARPKLVALTHRSLVLSAQSVARTLDLRPDDTCLSIVPLFHGHGFVGAQLASFAAGASVCCAPGFSATAFQFWLESSQATWYTAVPTMHQALLKRVRGDSSERPRHRLRLIRSCSSTLHRRVWEELQTVFKVPVLNAYGMTEAAHQVSSVRLPGLSCMSVGPTSGPEVGIMDPSGGLLPAGDIGEVVLRGRQIISRYLRPDEANEAAFCHGWFRTGDQGYLNADDALVLTGRLKELISSGGEKVSPYEVEEVLLRHPAVDQAVAFGWPDTRLGETVAVAIVVRAGCDVQERELLRLAAEHLSGRKRPRRIVFTSRIPCAGVGKVQRMALAEQLGLGLGV
jgi:acyl-CoA synthetase (AMP-forming)/AMP-acid ligase II